MAPAALEEFLTEAEELSRSLSHAIETPLRPVAERLIALLEGTVCAATSGESADSLRRAIGAVRRITAALPNSFGRRFHFDAAVIASVLEEWAAAGASTSPFTTPHYFREWGYYRVPMPSEDLERAHVVRVVTFPGADRLSDIDLCDYPWLIHELAHDAFYRRGHRFRESLDMCVQRRLQQLKLRASADTGRAARQAELHVEAIAHHWTPHPSQQDWGHEVATDIVALWSLGPAFLMRFTRLLVDDPRSAWIAADRHPPCLARAAALVLAAQRLGWSEAAWALEEELKLLHQGPERRTDALVHADPELLQAAVTASLEACQALSIPSMKPERFQALRAACHAPSAADLRGIDLIAAGAIARATLGASDYSRWLNETIEQLA